jgi:hypothetical protein
MKARILIMTVLLVGAFGLACDDDPVDVGLACNVGICVDDAEAKANCEEDLRICLELDQGNPEECIVLAIEDCRP